MFFVFKFFGVLNFTFDGKKFKFSKFLHYKMRIIFVTISIIKFFNQFSVFIITQKITMSLFSRNFLQLTTLCQTYLVIIMVWIHLSRQKKIAKIFTIFYDLKMFCDERNFKINLKKLKIKFLIFFILISVFLLDIAIRYLFFETFENWIVILKDFIDINILIYLLSFFAFLYFILIHCVFMLKKFNVIIENQTELIHDNCEFLLDKLIEIQKLFELVNESFGSTITIYVNIQLILITKVVSKI